MSGFDRRSAITYGIMRARWSITWIRIASSRPVPIAPYDRLSSSTGILNTYFYELPGVRRG
jgi:hypothetical protein